MDINRLYITSIIMVLLFLPYFYFYITYHLADTFIQSDLQ